MIFFSWLVDEVFSLALLDIWCKKDIIYFKRVIDTTLKVDIFNNWWNT